MFSGLRNLKTISTIVFERMELYCKLMSVEAEIAKTRLVQRALWGILGVVFAIFTLGMLHTLVISLFWYSEYRVAVILAVLVVDGVLAGTGIFLALKPAEQEAFAVTKEQLAKDIEYVRDSRHE
jgi:uncharacterized membrane protein YqjE